MPYWSSSKVGADPQGQPPSKHQQKKKFKGKKGITMEDLKKQTAIRLAQEQQKKGRGLTDSTNQNISSERVTDLVPPPIQAPASVEGKKTPKLKSASPALHDNRSPYVNQHDNEQQLTYQYAVEDKGSRRNFYHADPTQSPCYDYDALAPPNLSKSVFNPTASNIHMKSSAKLPHGLTVQELKEMTKARLQAEASDKVREEPRPMNAQYATLSTTNVLPQEFHDRRLPTNSIPSPSPVPSSYRGMRMSESSGRFIESREGMDSGSVSTATSEYPQSESVYSGGICNDDAMSAIPFSRSGSLPSNSGPSYEWRNGSQDSEPVLTSYVPSTPVQYYDRSGYAPNRRRAATLSPRPTSLSYLHEDRPIFANTITTVAPSASTPQPILPVPHYTEMRNFLEEPRLSVGQSLNYESGTRIGNENDYLANRSRTFSLPSSFQSSDALRAEHSGFGSNTPQRFLSQFEIVKEDIPSLTGLDTVFRESPSLSFNSEFNDHLLDSNTNSIGFGSTSSSSGNYTIQPPIRERAGTDYHTPSVHRTNYDADFPRAPGTSVDSRNRASTWDVGLGLFGSTTDLDAHLAADIASILKLSETELKDPLFPPPGF